MQPRFEKRVGSTPFGMVEQPRFRAGFDFMRLRADVGEVDEALADWWQEFSMADDTLRQDLVDQVREEQQRQRPRSPRVHSVAAGSTPRSAEPGGEVPAEESESGAAPKKRRRRRRASANKGGGEGAAEGGSQGAQPGQSGRLPDAGAE